MKILFTGFDPFGSDLINPSWEIVKALDSVIYDAEIIKLMVPTVFVKSIDVVRSKIEECNPDVVVCLGQAGGRFDITPERVAININDARIEDNEGNQPIDTKVYEDGDAAYFSSLPVKAIVKEIRSIGIPSSLSNTAGTFVCNHLMYGICYLRQKYYQNIKCGFIHVPYIPSQVVGKSLASLNINDMVLAMEAVVKAVVENPNDIVMGAGHTH